MATEEGDTKTKMDGLRENRNGAERAYDGGDEGQRSVEDKNPGSRPQNSL